MRAGPAGGNTVCATVRVSLRAAWPLPQGKADPECLPGVSAPLLLGAAASPCSCLHLIPACTPLLPVPPPPALRTRPASRPAARPGLPPPGGAGAEGRRVSTALPTVNKLLNRVCCRAGPGGARRARGAGEPVGRGWPGSRRYRRACSRAGGTGKTLKIEVTWGTEGSGGTGRTERARGVGLGRGRAVAAGSVIRGGRFVIAIAARPGPLPPFPRGLPALSSLPPPPSPSPPSSLPPVPPGAAARRCRGESAVAKGGAALYPGPPRARRRRSSIVGAGPGPPPPPPPPMEPPAR